MMDGEREIQIEELSEAPAPPPKARVDDVVEERPRDYLDGFLKPQPAIADGEVGGDLYERVVEALVRGIERVRRIFG